MRALNLILDEIDSTQLEIKRRLAENGDLAHLSYVHALKQTAGQGRRGREWKSGEGNFYGSFILRGPHASVTWVPLHVAVALKTALEKTFRPRQSIKLKWPNDLMIEPSAKLAGILCEKIGDVIVVGVGVNLAYAPDVDGREVTALQNLISSPITQNDNGLLREAFLEELRASLSVEKIERAFELHSLFEKGDLIEWVDLQTQDAGSGLYLGLGPHGELNVETNGVTQKLFSEEISSVKRLKKI